MKAVVIGADSHLDAMVKVGMNFLATRPEGQTMAECASDTLVVKWGEVKRLILARIDADGKSEPQPAPDDLIDALCELAMTANGLMWVYLAVQGTLTIGGDQDAMAEFRRMLTEGPLS